MASNTLSIEVVYARQGKQSVVPINLPSDTTVEQAIAASKLLQQFPEIDLDQQKIGIFGQVCKLDKLLTDGDRVEIYRPLQQDPMTARRHRLQK
jgi:putative ubiquitin-RnfH superfamily antitoxin RatB of RatAB toxin-antitoxin module